MNKKVIGLYPMVGDLLHVGHILALQEAKNNCDYLIVALNACPENKKPIQSIVERTMQLNAVKFVDKVIVYEGKKDLELIADILVYDIRFVGEDYKDKTWDGKAIEILNGIEFHYLSRKHSLSSTELKERIIRSCSNE